MTDILIIYHEYMLGQKTVMLFQWIQDCCFRSKKEFPDLNVEVTVM